MTMKNMKDILGLTVLGISFYSEMKKVVILFDEQKYSLNFRGCPLAIDTGIIGQKIRVAEEYSGEMGFVLELKKMKLDVDDFKYFILEGRKGEEWYQNKLRIAYKYYEIEDLGE